MTLYLRAYPFRRTARCWMEQPQQNSLNVGEEDHAFIISALVPGLQAEDLNIQVLENVIKIEGEIPAEETEYLLKELPNGAFRRT